MRVLRNDYEVIGIARHGSANQNELAVDITETQNTLDSIVKSAPHAVIHTAAETNVDRCEIERDLARRVNVEGTANVAEACAKVAARLIFVSTDYVFDGAKGDYREEDQPNPVNFYGLTKLEGERVVASTLANHLIVRASVLYGWHPRKLNFVTWILKGLREHQSLRIVKDHINSPTYADNLAEAIHRAIERSSEGILNIAGSDGISRFDFACKIAKRFDLNQSLLVPVKLQDLDWVARRPRDSSLNVGKAEKELGIELFGVDRGLEEMVKNQQ